MSGARATGRVAGIARRAGRRLAMEEFGAALITTASGLDGDWRGGITCRVVEGGLVRLGDGVDVLHAPPRKIIRLPG